VVVGGEKVSLFLGREESRGEWRRAYESQVTRSQHSQRTRSFINGFYRRSTINDVSGFTVGRVEGDDGGDLGGAALK
jgi:hypothetical protein